MKRIVGVRFKKGGRVYYFDPGDMEMQLDDGVIVETARGMEFGEVALIPQELPEEQLVAPLKDVLRIATEEDRLTHDHNQQMEQEAFTVCQQKIIEHSLDMKLVNVEYTFNASKITFFFTSDGRVDFRELVKDLAAIFKTRIELRQIGVRDEAKMLGGLGSCGRPVCCKAFLPDFQPVSIKMAKEQKLSLSPTKISGLCGRLMCCLKYEQDSYESMRKQMPKLNKEVITVDGKGIVLDNNVITERTKVRITLPDGTPDIREYHFSNIRKPNSPEEEASMLRELIDAAKAQAAKAQPAEEVFRFVVGATPEAVPAAVAETAIESTGQPAPKNTKRRPRHRSGGNSSNNNNNNTGGSNADNAGNKNNNPAASGNKPPRPPQEQPAHTEGAAPAEGNDAPKKPHRSRRGGRNRHKKPSAAPQNAE